MKRLLLSIAAIAGLATSGEAQQISSAGHPALVGATLVNFNLEPTGVFTSRSFGNLTISGIGAQLKITNQFAGLFGATGMHLQNDNGTSRAQGVRFTFAGGTSAFGFSLGAADTRASSLSAYDINQNLLFSYATPFNSPGFVDYVGIAASGIAYAELTLHSFFGAPDDVVIDDVSFQGTVVPEPASLALLGAALLVVIPAVRRRSRKA